MSHNLDLVMSAEAGTTEIARARVTVLRHARTPEDAFELLDALGLPADTTASEN